MRRDYTVLYSPFQIGKAITRAAKLLMLLSHLSDGLRRHPPERHQQRLLRLVVVLLVGRAVAPEITDFDMITFANQAVPVRRLGDQFNPQTHSILTSAP